MEPPVCKNIRSRRHPDQRCPNPASHGEYCGVHYKFPRQYKSAIELAIQDKTNITVSPIVDMTPSAIKVQKWWTFRGRLRIRARQGPARYTRESTNTTDFYSMEDITGLSGEHLFSYFEVADKQIYAFDVRSLSSLLEKSEEPLNPYTRTPFSDETRKKMSRYIRWCRKKGIDTRWTPIDATTPDQRFHIKVTDMFQKIDELNYYTNPEWFINLTVDRLRCFYVELYDIWFHRAELTNAQRSIIIPPPARPFRYPIRDIVTNRSIDFLRKTNMDVIRMFVSAAEDKSDRVLGAMYIVTALTMVSRQCAQMYPWLFESATPGIYERYRVMTNDELPIMTLNALTYINTILAGIPPSPLALPPPE